MKRQVALLSGILFLFIMTSMASATSMMIDHFVYDPLVPDLTANSAAALQTATQTDATTILGTKRFVALRWVSGQTDVTVKRPSGPANDYVTCGSEFGTVGSWEFDWGNTYAGGGSLGNFLNAGGYGFEIAFLGSDAAVGINMTVLPTVGTPQTVVQSAPVGPGLVVFTFESFNTIPYANFTSIDSIRFDFTAPANADFAIDYIGIIPEPTSIALFGLLGMGLIRRRR